MHSGMRQTHTQDKAGLFHVTTSLLLRETSQKNLTCSVWNPVLNQKKEEQLFTTAAEPDSTTIIIMGIVLAVLVLLTSIITGLYLNNSLKNRHKTRNKTQISKGSTQRKSHQ
ncbi:PREDICTED: putative selection and upkeep of intraepithelial T-cells protein 1 homolog [Myotis davidii]|uniref:putative selection and upkeep of intraepithelial T-cells protein 1 homolog n=1 Tax=Myotis davidii TaxID=225400 RepID=UPI00076724B8|nr:PREDICTED: putative selection and upkeep of intraepithelial T-cells protein 1 homolog [Myotis davidii]